MMNNNREFYVQIDICNLDLEELPGYEKSLPWIDITVYEKELFHIFKWRFDMGNHYVRGRYQIVEEDPNIKNWISKLDRKEETILEFKNKTDLDSFLIDNDIAKYAVEVRVAED